MKYIIVIRGVHLEEYEDIKKDINTQCAMAGYPHPLIFAYLTGNEPAIEIVWTDADMELKHLEMITNRS